MPYFRVDELVGCTEVWYKTQNVNETWMLFPQLKLVEF